MRHKEKPRLTFKRVAKKLLLVCLAILICAVVLLVFNHPLGMDRAIELTAEALGESFFSEVR